MIGKYSLTACKLRVWKKIATLTGTTLCFGLSGRGYPGLHSSYCSISDTLDPCVFEHPILNIPYFKVPNSSVSVVSFLHNWFSDWAFKNEIDLLVPVHVGMTTGFEG